MTRFRINGIAALFVITALCLTAIFLWSREDALDTRLHTDAPEQSTETQTLSPKQGGRAFGQTLEKPDADKHPSSEINNPSMKEGNQKKIYSNIAPPQPGPVSPSARPKMSPSKVDNKANSRVGIKGIPRGIRISKRTKRKKRPFNTTEKHGALFSKKNGNIVKVENRVNISNEISPQPETIRDLFMDGTMGPEMVVIPAGAFKMGDLRGNGRADEKPVHSVHIRRPFAIGKHEVTVALFRSFIEETAYKTDAEQGEGSIVFVEGKGDWIKKYGVTWRDNHHGEPTSKDFPVIHVSWNDAKAYINWLKKKTGKDYRLPSEAELEYVNRAKSTSQYWWGDLSPRSKMANIAGEKDRSLSGTSWEEGFQDYSDGYWGPAPVASFSANNFGLHDTTGNVLEWAEDCYHDSYEHAPNDGSAWKGGGCSHRVLRGGSWFNGPVNVRSAARIRGGPAGRGSAIGFRLARDLDTVPQHRVLYIK